MTGWARALLWTIGGIAALFAILWVVQRRLVYLPGSDVPPIEGALPAWSETRVETADGEHLGVWHVPPDGMAPTVVVFNGNAGTRAGRAPLGARLAEQGHGVVLFDYRGYGDSTGAPSEEGLHRDAEAIHAFVTGVSPGSPLVLYGESLGAAVAIRLAAQHDPSALILRSPFTSLGDVASVHYPLPFDGFLRDRFPSVDRIADVDAPVLTIVGTADQIVPPSLSRALHRAASEPKRLVEIDGAGHNDPALLSGDRLIEAVTDFIRRHAGG